jgi:hypothetical protein
MVQIITNAYTERKTAKNDNSVSLLADTEFLTL